MGVFSSTFLRTLRGRLDILTQIIDLLQVKKVLRSLGANVPIRPANEPLENLLTSCLDQAFREGWGDLFIARLWSISSRPGPLREFARQNEVVATKALGGTQLEEVLRASQSYLDAGQWLFRLAQIGHQVCQVEVNAKSVSAGLLIGPDLLLTGSLETESISRVTCQFYDGGTPDVALVASFGPAPDGLLVNDKDGGFALLRLTASAGAMPIGENGPPRGWLSIPSGGYQFPAKSFLASAYQEPPEGLRITFSAEAVVEAPLDHGENRLRHRLPLGESRGGAPCFTPEWEVVAIHYRQDLATPLSLVRRRLQELGSWSQVEAGQNVTVTARNQQSIAAPVHGQSPVMRSSPVLAVGLGYLQAASVLAYFDPAELQPLGGGSAPDDDTLEALLRQCQADIGPDNQPNWSLKDGARREALESMTSQEDLARALTSNSRPVDSLLQRSLDGCILGTLRPIGEQSDAELAATARVVGWLEGLPVRQPLSLPRLEQISLRLDWLRLLNALKESAGPHFRGRSKELNLLKSYVDAPVGEQDRPLVLWGVGGIGKTGLLARFLLDLVESEPQIPFVLFDFDRPGLSADDPVGLLAEAVRQLHARFADLLGTYGPYLLNQLANLKRQSGSRKILQPGEIFRDFGQMLTQAGLGPLVLVFDTFEELQSRSREQVASLFEFVAALENHVSRLRPIFGGRAPIEARTFVYRGGLEARNELLGPLDSEAASASLEALGVEPELAKKVVERVGGHPLVLRLAAEVVRRSPKDRPETWEFEDAHFQADLQEAIKQGFLFERIRDHLKDKDAEVAQLIIPGLIVRNVTAEVIDKVLAAPCGLDMRGPGRAESLFERLKLETTLVSLPSAGVLRFRPELRREMLRLLRRSDNEGVRRIHQAAIEFYGARSDAQYSDEDRAEEIYHRLALAQSSAELDPRWNSAVEVLLEDAVDELPPTAGAYLASKHSSGLESVDPGFWESANLPDWERRVVIRLNLLIGEEKYQEALGVLAERDERSGDSPLFALHARVLASLGRWEEALGVIQLGLTRLLDWGSDRNLLDLWLESVPVKQHLGNLEAARKSLRKAQQFAEKCGTQADRLNILRWQSRLEPSSDPDVASRTSTLMEAVEAATEVELRESAAVARELAARIGKGSPSLVGRILEAAGPETIEPQNQELLVVALAAWDKQLSPDIPGGSRVASLAGLSRARASSHEELWRNWAAHITPLTWSMTLGKLVRENPPNQLWDAIVQLLLPAELQLPKSTPPSTKGSDSPDLPSSRTLSGEMVRRFHHAILNAYDHNSLEQLLRFRLDRRLDEVVSPGHRFDQVVFEVITLAESEGWLRDLFRALLQGNPQNQELKVVCMELEALL